MSKGLLLLLACSATTVLAQEPPAPPRSFIKMSPILNAADANQDGVVSTAEITGAPAQLIKLDKNGDGKLSQAEAGLQLQPGGGRGGRAGDGGGGRGGGEREIPPIPGPTADELTATLMAFDANKNGQLERSEVPQRMQGMFDNGDTNKDGVLTHEEIVKLADANRQGSTANPGRGGGGPGGQGGGRGRGPGGADMAFAALDLNHDGEISGDEISAAASSLKTLDKNNDGRITDDEVTPAFGGGRGPAGPGRGE